MAKPIQTIVHLEALTVLAFVGLKALERNEPQKIVIDVDCTLKHPEVSGDALEHSADYVPIAHAIRTPCVEKKRKLIETLAEEIASVCFAQGAVQRVRVRVRKPFKMPDCAFVGTTRTFTR